MKAKVLMPFKDKRTGETMKPDTVFECSQKRFAEIKKSGNYVVAVKEEAKPKAERE